MGVGGDDHHAKSGLIKENKLYVDYFVNSIF